MRAVAGEIDTGHEWPVCADGSNRNPFLLLGRYKDHIYVIYAHVSEGLRPWVDYGAALFLQCLYGVPLK